MSDSAHSDPRAWLQLVHARGIGPVRGRALLDHFGSIAALIGASNASLRSAGLSDALSAALTAAADSPGLQADLDWADGDACRLLPLDHPDYPMRLRQLHDAPLLLYLIGDAEVLNTPQLAMVGSRNPTPSGAETAEQFAHHLAQRGLTITSGLALGIDGAAHRGALQGNGLTIAVAGTGLDRVYPARHHDLARQIAREGALLSELPIGSQPRAENFPRRNRIIAGLSLGVLVVEAALRSGSLLTARQASEQGREVFAIPGSIHNPLARGCHRLIRDGGKLVETADDVLEELAPLLSAAALGETRPSATAESSHSDDDEPLDAAYVQLLACIDHDPQPLDVFVARSGLPAKEVASMLLMLELKDLVRTTGGGCYQRS